MPTLLTNIAQTVLDWGNEIILGNWPHDKHIICNVSGDIPVKFPVIHPCVLVNRSVLCNYGLEAENNFLLESLAACHSAESKLVMYFTVNMAFVNNLDSLDNLTETLEFPILHNWSTHKQTLPISLQSFEFDTDLLKAPKMVKDLSSSVSAWKSLQERHINDNGLDVTNKNLSFNNYTIDVFLFVTAIISLGLQQ